MVNGGSGSMVAKIQKCHARACARRHVGEEGRGAGEGSAGGADGIREKGRDEDRTLMGWRRGAFGQIRALLFRDCWALLGDCGAFWAIVGLFFGGVAFFCGIMAVCEK